MIRLQKTVTSVLLILCNFLGLHDLMKQAAHMEGTKSDLQLIALRELNAPNKGDQGPWTDILIAAW